MLVLPCSDQAHEGHKKDLSPNQGKARCRGLGCSPPLHLRLEELGCDGLGGVRTTGMGGLAGRAALCVLME